MKTKSSMLDCTIYCSIWDPYSVNDAIYINKKLNNNNTLTLRPSLSPSPFKFRPIGILDMHSKAEAKYDWMGRD